MAAKGELQEILTRMDAVVDTYHGGTHGVTDLLEMRRELAVYLYRLTGMVLQVYGAANLAYVRRKWEIARAVVEAQNADAKLATGKAEYRAETLANVKEAKNDEAMNEAQREAVKAKMDGARQVLQAMQQEIAFEVFEAKTTHFQTAGAATPEQDGGATF